MNTLKRITTLVCLLILTVTANAQHATQLSAVANGAIYLNDGGGDYRSYHFASWCNRVSYLFPPFTTTSGMILVSGSTNGVSFSTSASASRLTILEPGHVGTKGNCTFLGIASVLRLDFWLPSVLHPYGQVGWSVTAKEGLFAYSLNGIEADGTPIPVDALFLSGMRITIQTF